MNDVNGDVLAVMASHFEEDFAHLGKIAQGEVHLSIEILREKTLAVTILVVFSLSSGEFSIRWK